MPSNNSENICIQEILFPTRKPWRKIFNTSLTVFAFKPNTCKKWQFLKATSLQIYNVTYWFFSDLAPCYIPAYEKAYAAWTLGSKGLGKNVARKERSPLPTPALILNSCRNMSITGPQACITLSLILKAFVCGWQFHVPVSRGNDYRKELIFDQGGRISWWSGCDRNPGRKWPSSYALLISKTINFK